MITQEEYDKKRKAARNRSKVTSDDSVSAEATLSPRQLTQEEYDIQRQNRKTLSLSNPKIINKSQTSVQTETDVPELDETPEQFYLRTGEVPLGYKYVPSVPVSDTDPELNVKLERIESAPVAEQTDDAFELETTAKVRTELFGEEGIPLLTAGARDITGAMGASKKYVPEVLQPLSNVIAQMSNDAVAGLVYGVTAVGETVTESAEKVTRTIHETFDEDNKIMGMTGKELIPFDPETSGKKFGADLLAMLEVSEGLPVAGVASATATRTVKQAIKQARKEAKIINDRANKRMRIERAKEASAEQLAKKEEAARIKAEANREISDTLIEVFEERTGKTISDTKAGHKVINPELARRAGVEKAQEASELVGVGDELVQPMLVPEKLDALVATIADLKTDPRFASAFDNDKPVIDNLLELTVNQDLLARDELLDILNKYNLSIEDYILTVVGSGSEAGRTLQKFSQIKRVRPTNEVVAAQEEAAKEATNGLRKAIMRVENIRRGGLVSQVATAARNLSSGVIRAPMEGLGNVMDNALYMLDEKGYKAAAGQLVSFSNYKDSFRHMKYMFGPDAKLDAEDYVDYILRHPELDKQADLLFNNINEIQKMTGRGDGGKLDSTLSVLEDAVDMLNTPNRWQEHLIRRGAFLGELERLVKREYDIDLIETLNKGQIRDLLNDATTVRPPEARSFLEIVEDATNKALDITYAKQPDIPVFRSTSQFIVRNGLTVVLPFPRFMFNSMELMGQYAAGASIPLTKKVMSIVTKGEVPKMTMKDRQRISRNLQGIAVAGAAYMYRTSDDAPADYKKMSVTDETEADITPQYPMRQFLFIGESMKRLNDGTFDDWFDFKEFNETFVGTNIREGVGQSIIQEMADLVSTTDLAGGEAGARAAGRLVGNYLSTWAVPYSQVIEAERALGMRGLEYKETGQDPTLDAFTTFKQNVYRPFARLESPESEADRASREFLFAEEKKRVAPLARVLGGINLTTKDEEYGEYIKSLGFTEYELASTSKVPSIRNYENKAVRMYLPVIVDSARGREATLRNQYANLSDDIKNMVSEDKYVSVEIRKLIKSSIKSIRSRAREGNLSAVESPEYSQAMMDYRRLSKEARQIAGVKFIERNGREPDPLNKADLREVVLIGEAYDKAMK